MNGIKLDMIEVKNNRVTYFFSVTGSIKKYFNSHNSMFLEYNEDISDIPLSILTIPFVANVIPLVWITNSTLQLRELDQSFYQCLPELRESYQQMFPNVEFKGTLIVDNIISHEYNPEKEAASFFSGGLDAVTTYIRISEKKPILITEYGWHEEQIIDSDVWEADKKNAIEFAKRNQLENILIQSNYGTFIKARDIDQDFQRRLGDTWWHGLHHGLAIITAAIPIAYKLKVECLYIASSNSPAYPIPCASDPSTDNKIKFSSGKVYHDGYELTRQDKVRVLVNHYAETNERIDVRVCFKNEENCCKCEKCLRTIMGIIAEGKYPSDYGFNIGEADISNHVRTHLYNEVKFFTDIFIEMYWRKLQKRVKENEEHIPFKELVRWFINFEFEQERKKSLLQYRITQFFPIVKRKITQHVIKLPILKEVSKR